MKPTPEPGTGTSTTSPGVCALDTQDPSNCDCPDGVTAPPDGCGTGTIPFDYRKCTGDDCDWTEQIRWVLHFDCNQISNKKLEPPYATIWSAPYRWKMRNGLIGWQENVLSTVQQMTSVLLRHHVSVILRTNVEPVLINRLELVKVLTVQLKLIIWKNTRKNMLATLLNAAISPKLKLTSPAKYFASTAGIRSPCPLSVSQIGHPIRVKSYGRYYIHLMI